MDCESPAMRATRENFERRFMNAETTYDRYLVFKDLMSWIRDLQELNDLKDKKIVELQSQIKGYD